MPTEGPVVERKAKHNESSGSLKAANQPREPNEVPAEGRVPAIWFALFGSACGFLIILTAIFAVWFDPSMSRYRWPMIVVGLACICASLGGIAVVRYKGITAGGVAAVVIALGLVFQPDPPPPPTPRVPYVYGYIRGTSEMTSVLVGTFLTGRLADRGDFEFFAREEQIEIGGKIFAIRAENSPGRLPAKIIVGCIPVSILRDRIGSRDGVDLSLSPASDNPSEQLWVLRETGKSEPLGEFGNPVCRTGGILERTAQLLNLTAEYAKLAIFPLAQAEEAEWTAAKIIESLGAPSLATQTEVQNAIAGLRDPQAMSDLFKLWSPPSNPSSIDENMVVALVQGIRANRVVATHIVDAISSRQVTELVRLAGNPDKVVRFNSTELLSWILQATRWPSPPAARQVNIVEMAVADILHNPGTVVSEASNNSVYNLLIAIQDSACAKEDKRLGVVIYGALENFGSRSDAVVDNLEKSQALARTIGSGAACQS